MTLFFFAPNAATVMMAHGRESIKMFQSHHVATSADLEAAKKELEKMDAIFFTESMGQWDEQYSKSGLPFSESISKVGCQFPHDNVIECNGCPTSPTEKELALATELNQLDIQLYEYAKTLRAART